MAKLEGVKVLDMKYGEILRVEYDGEIYEKVDGPAQKGDIVLSNGVLDAAEGNFYMTVGGLYGIPAIYDDKGDRRDTLETFTVFRKISVQPSLADRVTAVEAKLNDLSSRVDKLEGKIDDGYRLVTDREPRVGDYVKFDDVPVRCLTVGKYYKIVDFDGDDPIIVDDDGDGYDTFGTEFEVYEKVTEEKGADEVLEVGDYVVALPSADGAYSVTNTKMKLGKVVRDLNDGFVKITVVAHEDKDYIGEEYFVCVSSFRKATEDEIRAALKSKIEVGDYVRLIESSPRYGKGLTNKGDVGKVVKINGNDLYINFPRHSNWRGLASEVEKITDEYVLKFLRAERKPGEFKVGDIVRGPEGNPIVDIFEIIEIREGSTHPIRFINRNGKNDGFSINANLTLIAPVEARVDRP